MRIALAIENFSKYAGGAESYAVDLAKTLIAENWEVHLFGNSWEGEPAQAHFHHIPKLPKFFPSSVRILFFALWHKRLVSREKFDVVLGFGNTIYLNAYQSHGGVHALSTARKIQGLRSPVLRFIKSVSALLSPKHHARAWIESAAFRRPDTTLIAISDMVRDDISEHFGIDKSDINLVYNGIDTERFGRIERNTAKRTELGFSDQTLFLFMGYDFRKKGTAYLIEAAGKLADEVGKDAFGVVIVGRPPYPALAELVSKYDISKIIRFPGATREPEAFYAACDVFVLPTFYDACSLVVFEAMAAGLPAITTSSNGAAGVIDNGVDGIVLADPRDTDGLAEAMKRFLDRTFLAGASEKARTKASHYTQESNHKQMLKILGEVGRNKPFN